MGKLFKGFLGVAFLVVGLIGLTVLPAAAQVTIPPGSTVNSAIFSIYEIGPNNQVVYLHRLTTDWDELTVTINSLGGQWDAAVAGSFVADASYAWKTVDLTALVQAWVNGVPNYGFIMMQDPMTPACQYRSSEYTTVPAFRPKLEIWYTTPAGLPQYVMIQRPGLESDGVADAAIRDFINHGSDPSLTTGYYNDIEKYSVVKFRFTVLPSPGTGTPGYWMNHPEAWPVDMIVIGGLDYTRDEAIAWMRMPVATDKTLTMFPALVAAKLNVLIGNSSGCISSTIAAADAWMAMYPVGSGVIAGRRSPWGSGEPLYLLLDQYNNGLLCAPHRD